MKAAKFLIIGPSWLGDMIMSQALYKKLKILYPDCTIEVLAPVWCLAIVARMPEVDRVFELPFKHGEFAFWKRYRLAKGLRAHNYSHAIVLPGSFKSALVPFFAKIKHRIGYFGEIRYGLLNNIFRLQKNSLLKMVERYQNLAFFEQQQDNTTINFPKLKIDKNNAQQVMQRLNLTLTKKVIALCPGAAYGPSKCWPPEYFANFANQKLKDGYAIWFLGSEQDKAVINEIMGKVLEPCISLAGKTSLVEAVDLLAEVDSMLCNDSGLMHLGASIGVPLIAFYGPTAATFAPPLTKNAIVLEHDLPCRPCKKRTCPLKHHDCMQKITPAIALDAFNNLQVTND